ncbi:DUF2076 domain-containing protein [Terripilifer ovatus]|uniref:DUF2076 domain-containing protein n=1 Tax=Terripilifer ovatus TaxID=3032367 RepID=UPI003AB96AC2
MARFFFLEPVESVIEPVLDWSFSHPIYAAPECRIPAPHIWETHMSPEERQLLTGLFDRVHAAGDAPRDSEAEAFIAAAVRQLPFAPYLLAQSVIVQDETLKAASQRIEELEARVRDLESAAKPQPSTSFLGGIGKSILGSGAPQQQPAQQPPMQERSPWTQMRQQQQEPMGQPQMGQPMGQYAGQPMGQQMPQAGGGGGFLKGALGTAAGVAGGMMLANSLSSMLGSHNSPFGSSPAKAADLPSSPGDSGSKNDALSDIDKWSDRNKDADLSRNDDGNQAYASDDSSSSDYDDSDEDSDGYDSGSDSWGDSDTTDV